MVIVLILVFTISATSPTLRFQ